mmetsp:Transcript_83218/g.165202  ORF Transcript_83218/g.165202 Transcript_83218/m.165202 type:complete len:407 (-) Transcript_83218:65-1285(-)
MLEKNEREKPLLGLPESRLSPSTVSVYSAYGGKEVVQTDGSNRCLNGILPCSSSCGAFATKADSEVLLVIRSSVWINFGLFLCKLYAFIASGSMAVLASLVDSAIDLLGQGALLFTSYLAGDSHEDYPIGRGRLEPVGVMICAVVMGMASIEVISTSTMRLLKFWNLPDPPSVVLSPSVAAMLVAIILLKAFLWIWCSRVAQRHPQNDAVRAIAQDNANDVLSNIVALIAPETIHFGTRFWVADPIAGIAISIYIIYTWLMTGYEQVEMIVGKRADTDFLRKVMDLAKDHHSNMELDQLNAYHFGPKYLVEIEVVMPESTTLRESHDAGIALQHKVEMLEEVERCFVHIDYQLRLCDDHDPNVPIEEKLYGATRRGTPRASDSSKPRFLQDDLEAPEGSGRLESAE